MNLPGSFPMRSWDFPVWLLNVGNPHTRSMPSPITIHCDVTPGTAGRSTRLRFRFPKRHTVGGASHLRLNLPIGPSGVGQRLIN
jgi:hypothetical protein